MADRLHEVLIAPREAFVPLPDTRVLRSSDWQQLITPSLPGGGLNEVCLAVLDPDTVEQRIEQTIAEYFANDIRFRWTVGPDSRPGDLAERLRARATSCDRLIGVAGDSPTLATQVVGGVDVAAVSIGDLPHYCEVAADGWGLHRAQVNYFHTYLLECASDWMRLFVARINQQAVGVGALALLPHSAYLIGAVVLPHHRGRGVYRALVTERARVAAASGRSLITCQALADSSAPTLQRLGFEPVVELESFQFVPPPL